MTDWLIGGYGGEWVLSECQREVRYNLIADVNGHAWIKGPHDCNVHHNIFVNYDTPDPNREAGIDTAYFTPHLTVYNNTFDGGGKVANLGVPAFRGRTVAATAVLVRSTRDGRSLTSMRSLT